MRRRRLNVLTVPLPGRRWRDPLLEKLSGREPPPLVVPTRPRGSLLDAVRAARKAGEIP